MVTHAISFPFYFLLILVDGFKMQLIRFPITFPLNKQYIDATSMSTFNKNPQSLEFYVKLSAQWLERKCIYILVILSYIIREIKHEIEYQMAIN